MKNTASIKVIKGIAEMRRFSLEARKRGAKIALVPTMGALHAGHLALVSAARQKADAVVVSIFVNPLQFGPREDLSAYPRDLAGDIAKLQKLGVAAVFTPEAAEIYPPGHRTHVEVDDLSQRLCGRARPTHFRGVATVVAKLFAIVQPHQAWFGQKDYQQLLIVRKMVRDLNFEVEIFDLPTVREADGLALSSRNSYLTPEQRPAALTLQQALHVAARIMAKGERSAAKIASNLREVIRAQPGAEIEYISICHPETLHELDTIEVRTLVALAVRVGRARLIDNTLFDLRELSLRADLKKPSKPAAAAKPVPSAAGGRWCEAGNQGGRETRGETCRESPSVKPAAKAAVQAAAKPASSRLPRSRRPSRQSRPSASSAGQSEGRRREEGRPSMMRVMLKAKIHRATVTDRSLDYEGSITIDLDLMDAVGLLPHEQVQVYNVTNGQRFETYTIAGPRGTGTICVNGAAAHLVENGHKIIIANYALFTDAELPGFVPRVALVDEQNRITKLT